MWHSGNTVSFSHPSNPPNELHLHNLPSDTVLTCASASSSSQATCTQPLAPPQAHYSSMQLQDDMFSQFFGAKPHRTRVLERHVPPPYLREGEFEKLPVRTAYPSPDADNKPIILTRYLFSYGFFFPIFWIVGIAIIFSPLRPTPEWGMGKSEEERQRLLAEMRVSELKWAKRCLYAMIALLVLVIIVLVTTLVLVRR
ncbi:uncharacterized protein EDB93DRAFT_1156452 [Suillus bovinus]|uniref:uncharacterized protein n=1 Tax=Suillus bovinus TaxID=48563 RepID=UPI001B86F184|nr:uncharacterized protein EDB93DRAFT_1188308 [Suillus bovinus]XP_041306101.1 uncharacterized protein EDB93DRAFT_1156452 [Suillus bovinus]KAG2126259.1 hypothetical protein EDB93DRAFT_1188308 [Suillus bovinus]KAG2143477.1 hypothetical protein EDB93DRAFT_1156452 [Suillus bovinus]